MKNTDTPISYSFPDMSLISRQPTKGSREGRAGGTTREGCTGGGLAGAIGIAGDLLWMGCRGRHPENFPVKKYRIFLQ